MSAPLDFTPVLDRVPSRPDPRRFGEFSVAAAGLVDSRGPRSYSWPLRLILNQGVEGACVGHGIVHELLASPLPVDFVAFAAAGRLPVWAHRCVGFWATNPPRTAATGDRLAQLLAFDLYDWARDHDYWEGRNYEGTSADAGAKGARELGLWQGWRWTRSVDEFATVVSRVGPGCLAVDWHTGMMQPDSDGYIAPTGQVEGGHFILARGFSVTRDAFRLPNSWTRRWGVNGECWLRREHLAQLAASHGEMLIPVGRSL